MIPNFRIGSIKKKTKIDWKLKSYWWIHPTNELNGVECSLQIEVNGSSWASTRFIIKKAIVTNWGTNGIGRALTIPTMKMKKYILYPPYVPIRSSSFVKNWWIFSWVLNRAVFDWSLVCSWLESVPYASHELSNVI